jgi:cell division septal protein FtsQ
MFPESEAWKAVPDHASLLLLNLDALERRIKDNPWVKGVEMMKDWESGIVTVEVEERRAVLDGDLGGRRIVLSADGTELPGLGGAALKRVGLDEAQLEEILRIGEVLEENGLVLDSVDEVDAGGIEATVEGRRVLFGGEVGEGQARTLKGLIEQYPEAPYFDLRSPERVVIDARSGG